MKTIRVTAFYTRLTQRVYEVQVPECTPEAMRSIAEGTVEWRLGQATLVEETISEPVLDQISSTIVT